MKRLGAPLFMLGLGLFLSLQAVVFTHAASGFWIGGLLVGIGASSVASELDRRRVRQ